MYSIQIHGVYALNTKAYTLLEGEGHLCFIYQYVDYNLCNKDTKSNVNEQEKERKVEINRTIFVYNKYSEYLCCIVHTLILNYE